MKETRDILNALAELPTDSKPVLATVVDVQGSSFRLPGARMLILDDGTAVGTVSGGCLEADVLEHAREVRETGKPKLVVYDTTNEEDSVFSLNMGCRGIIRILMQPAESSPELLFLKDNIEHSIAGVIATAISGDELGAQVIVDTNGVRHSSFSSPVTTQKVMVAADRVLRSKKSALVGEEYGEVFYDFVPLPIELLVFGAGAEAVPLVSFANDLGWHTHVIDHRPTYANAERIAAAEKISIVDKENLGTGIKAGGETLAVVMTHNFDNDKRIIRNLLETDIRYIGAMGPKHRTNKMFNELESEGTAVSEEMKAKIHGPVGLDLGATTPETIALSIIAEIQAFCGGRSGGYLKDREGSIYDRD